MYIYVMHEITEFKYFRIQELNLSNIKSKFEGLLQNPLIPQYICMLYFIFQKSEVEVAQNSWQFHQDPQSICYIDSLLDVPLEPHHSNCTICIEQSGAMQLRMHRNNSSHPECLCCSSFRAASGGRPSAWWGARLHSGFILTHSGWVLAFFSGNRTQICLQTGLPSTLTQQMALQCP